MYVARGKDEARGTVMVEKNVPQLCECRYGQGIVLIFTVPWPVSKGNVLVNHWVHITILDTTEEICRNGHMR